MEDMIGSRFEFDRGGWTKDLKDFDLLTAEDKWTDDTEMDPPCGCLLQDRGRRVFVREVGLSPAGTAAYVPREEGKWTF